jgi:hypothetical protein
MTARELINLARDRFDDEAEPYRWSDNTLLAHLNEAEREACRRAHLIIDKSTATYCRILVKPGDPNVTLNSKVLVVRACYLGPYVRGTLSWDAASHSLLDTSNSFVTAGFEEGDRFLVTGFTGTTNNGLFTASSVAAGAIVVDETTATDEEAETAVVEVQRKELFKKSRFSLDDEHPGWNTYEGEPAFFLQEADGSIRLVGIPVDPTTLHLVVSRLPAADMTLTPTITSPEIPTQYHVGLIDWMEHLAYLKDDADSGTPADMRRSQNAEARFTAKFGARPSARYEQFKKQYPRELRVRPRTFGS